MARYYDEQTIAFYDRDAAAYANRREPVRSPMLDAFIKRVGPGARVLELGTGGGQDARILLDAGMEVELTDGSARLAARASLRLGRRVRVMRFDQLDATEVYDGVWANACLLHVPEDALAGVLRKVWRCLKHGGIFSASFKAGDGGGRDQLGRYYNFPNLQDLKQTYAAAGPWRDLAIEQGAGGGYDGVARTWLFCAAQK